jgi:hypothetical protein
VVLVSRRNVFSNTGTKRQNRPRSPPNGADDKSVMHLLCTRGQYFLQVKSVSVRCRRRLQQIYAACVCWPQKQRCVSLPIAVRRSSANPPPWEAESSLPSRPLPEGLALLVSTQTAAVSLHTICNHLTPLIFLTLVKTRGTPTTPR